MDGGAITHDAVRAIHTKADQLIVGWALTGKWVGSWVCYGYDDAGRLQLVRELSDEEYHNLHQQLVMYWGEMVGTARVRDQPDTLVEAVFVRCRAASFAPTGTSTPTPVNPHSGVRV